MRTRRKSFDIEHGISGTRANAHAVCADESGDSSSKPAKAKGPVPAVAKGTSMQHARSSRLSPSFPQKRESTRNGAGPAGGTGSVSVKCPWAGSGRRLGGLDAAAVALVVATSMSLAPIPGAADEVGEAHEVVSVGSLMSAGAARDMQPITVIEREEIELSGMRNLWDFLGQSSRLPQLRPRPPLHPR